MGYLGDSRLSSIIYLNFGIVILDSALAPEGWNVGLGTLKEDCESRLLWLKETTCYDRSSQKALKQQISG